jgi:signal transduction histidine kinase
MPLSAGTSTPLRILVADDDPILREFAVTHLTTPEMEVLTAANGAEALALLHNQACDIALVDLDMPVMTGFELIAAIRADASLQHLPVIVITGREDMVAIDEAFSAGATSFVVKPLNWLLLSHQITYVLRNARNEQHLRAARDLLQASDARKGDVLRLMRHEFNTPLNAIVGFSRLIAESSSDLEARNHAGEVITAAAGLKRLSDDLSDAALAVSGEITVEQTCFAPGDVLASAAAAALQDTGLDGSRLRVLDRTGTASVTTDFWSLRLAIRNLLRNALTHGSPDPSGPPAMLVANVQKETGTLLISILDAGPGMTQSLVDTARQAFTQADGPLTRSSGGLGLGIAVTDAHVAALGGRINFAPRDTSGGLIATVILPGVVSAFESHQLPATTSAAA